MAELERETCEIREMESQPSVARGGRWPRLRFDCMKLGHQHLICLTLHLVWVWTGCRTRRSKSEIRSLPMSDWRPRK